MYNQFFKKIVNKNFINGEFLDISNESFYNSKNYISVTNPSTLEEIGLVPNLTDENISFSIDVAYKAMNKWKNTLAKERSKILKNLYNLIIENIDDLANIIVLENGKSLEDAKKEIIYGANFIDWFSAKALSIQGSITNGVKENQNIILKYEPIGVVGAITPWNFPSAMVSRKIAPALAAGCSVILKPSEYTPFSSLALCYLAKKAGVPDGVLNVITADAQRVSEKFTSDKRVRKITFTGSTRVGKILYKSSHENLKKLSLELGGNASFIIFDDYDIEKAADSLLNAKIRSSGQACTSPNRIFIHSNIYDKFIEKIYQKFSDIKIGNGLNDKVNVGPLITRSSAVRVKNLIEDAKSKGAIVKIGGNIAEFFFNEKDEKEKTTDKHSFFEPTIIYNCNENMRIFHEEIFGPVIACYKFNNDQDVINMANNSLYGLSSYIFTENHSRAWRMMENLDCGIVGINESIISNEIGAFGGRKDSGFGVEGSELGIYEFLNTKYICMNY